ncbi:MAG: hypothetical protein Hyperionvirus27_15 [Hyperionvirus sp.]|uniref:Uncharacterized protein n=1 Tax=Hyperionvirus sp. TaxID=2487770 RepID=A0A3G5AB88_9VIRU|nr:MAG: hypothetical protein Hyperionvirus27_15 [Hyperionvirus sp.]
MAFSQSCITFIVTGFLTAREVVGYSRISRLSHTDIDIDIGETSNQIWTMLKNRDMLEVEDLVSSLLAAWEDIVTQKSIYFAYSRKLGHGGGIHGIRVDPINFFRPRVAGTDRKMNMKDYRSSVLKNGRSVDAFGLVVLNTLVGFEWREYCSGLSDPDSFRLGCFMLIIARDMLRPSLAPPHSYDGLSGLVPIVIQWLRIWIEEGLISCAIWNDLQNKIIPSDEQMLYCIFRLIGELDGVYAGQISRNYTDYCGNRVALFRARAPLP